MTVGANSVASYTCADEVFPALYIFIPASACNTLYVFVNNENIVILPLTHSLSKYC